MTHPCPDCDRPIAPRGNEESPACAGLCHGGCEPIDRHARALDLEASLREIARDARTVAEFVSRGRRARHAAGYPDAAARRLLGLLDRYATDKETTNG